MLANNRETGERTSDEHDGCWPIAKVIYFIPHETNQAHYIGLMTTVLSPLIDGTASPASQIHHSLPYLFIHKLHSYIHLFMITKRRK